MPRFILLLLYGCGLRLDKAVAARVDHLHFMSYASADEEPLDGWDLLVLGKGEKERLVPVPLDAIGDLSKYLVARGLDPIGSMRSIAACT